MYDLLGPLVMIGIFFSINLMSVHDPTKFKQYRVIFAKSAADTKNRMFFRDRTLFMADTVLLLFLYLANTTWAASCHRTSRWTSCMPPSSGCTAVASHPCSSPTLAHTLFCTMAPAPSPFESGPRKMSSLSAGL